MKIWTESWFHIRHVLDWVVLMTLFIEKFELKSGTWFYWGEQLCPKLKSVLNGLAMLKQYWSWGSLSSRKLILWTPDFRKHAKSLKGSYKTYISSDVFEGLLFVFVTSYPRPSGRHALCQFLMEKQKMSWLQYFKTWAKKKTASLLSTRPPSRRPCPNVINVTCRNNWLFYWKQLI